MKRNLFKSLLAIACLLSSTSVSAYDFEVDGIYYDILSYDECEVVSGNKKYEGDIVIPATIDYDSQKLTVIRIAPYTFEDCLDLTGITIPNTINSVGYRAFNWCKKLEQVKIEDGETTLELSYDYYSLSSYSGMGLFYHCPITTLYIGRNLSYETSMWYGYSPFYGIKTIKELTIGDFVTEISENAFRGCSALTSIMIPNSVVYIGSYAFASCSALASISLPNSVTGIGSSAFSNCSALTSISLPNSVNDIESYAFSGCSALTSILLPNSVTGIGSSAFSGCSALTSITLPNSVTDIGSSAFRNCSALMSITLPNSITKIASSMFEGCKKLTSLTIPNSVTSIGEKAFGGCTTLTSIIIPNSVTEISESMFSDCSGLASITIGNGVMSIGSFAFENCSSLTEIFIPNNIMTINNYAFKGCYNLKNVNIEDGETVLDMGYNSYEYKSIGQGLFYNCHIENLYLGRNLSYKTYQYGMSPFYGITTIKKVTIGSSVSEIGDDAFGNCNGLKTLYSHNLTPPVISSSTFASYHYDYIYVNVPSEALTAYQSAVVWEKFKNFKGDPTMDIEKIRSKNDNSTYYNLHGNRLNAPQRGLNIINGKKVIMK